MPQFPLLMETTEVFNALFFSTKGVKTTYFSLYIPYLLLML